MNTKENYDRIIEKEHIGHTTLALLTNQDALSTREVGIFTLDDLISIHRHVYFSLSLPWKKNDILKWFGITSSTTLPIDTDELINTIINIRDHANTWDNVEQHVKEQSVNLSLASRNIIQTGGQIIEYINHMPILKRVSDSLNDINESELDEIFYQSDDQQIATELTNILQLIKDDIKDQSIKTSNIKNIISDFRVHITGGYLSNYQHVESLLFNIKGLYNQLETTDNEITDSYLQELLKMKKQELLTRIT